MFRLNLKTTTTSGGKPGSTSDLHWSSDDDDDEEEDEEERLARATPVRGPMPTSPSESVGGKKSANGSGSSSSWGSCIRLIDPSNQCETLEVTEMGRNEAALCCCSVRFHTRGGESLLAVGSVSNMSFHPIHQTASHVALYRVVNGERLQLLHKTTIESNTSTSKGGATGTDNNGKDAGAVGSNNNVGGPILALAHFQGRLLVGIGRTLRLYEMGKRQLLRKCELRGLPTCVKTLQTAGNRYVCCCGISPDCIIL